MLISHAVVLEKKSKISQPIRGQDNHLGYLKKILHFYRTPRGIIVVSLVANSDSEEVKNVKSLGHTDNGQNDKDGRQALFNQKISGELN